jgi:hypothetical protein
LRYTVLKLAADNSPTEVPNDTVFHAGDRIRFSVEANAPGYLYIINQGSSGNWKPMFPSAEIDDGNNHIEGWRPYTMPPKSRLAFDSTVGTENLFIVFSLKPEDDLESMIYSLQGKKKAAAAAPEAPVQSSKELIMAVNISNTAVDRMRAAYGRDLIIEKVDPSTPGDKRETAVYVVNPTGNADSHLVADLHLVVPALCLAAVLAFAQSGSVSHTMTEGSHRMELVLERLDRDTWRTIDPGLVLAQGDRVRFKFRTNFDGYLYVMNQSSSGTYEQLFPRDETGKENRIAASREYQVPATSAAFRIAGPAGHEVVYWMVSPARLSDTTQRPPSLPATKAAPPNLIPRCDDVIFKSRGDCVDPSAGPKLVPRGEALPQNLVAPGVDREQRDLLFLRQKNTAVISSPVPLSGPVIYEYRLAHR